MFICTKAFQHVVFDFNVNCIQNTRAYNTKLNYTRNKVSPRSIYVVLKHLNSEKSLLAMV